MLKVTLCSYDIGSGDSGPLTWCLRIADEFKRRGVDLQILIFNWGDPELGVAYSNLGRSYRNVHARRFSDTASNVRWLLEQVRASPPDVFIANHVIPAYYAAGSLRRAGIPTVGILRSDESFYDDIVEQFVFGQRNFRVSGIVGVSRFLSDQVEKRNPPGTHVRWIPSGTPFCASIPDRRVHRGPLRIAYVGRLAQEQKRIRETVEALILATGRFPGSTAVLFGDGPERHWVEERLRSADAAGVHLAGSIESHLVPEKLQEFDVIVLLSDFEGTPTAVMEAMAAGCVPICHQMRSGIPELIDDGANGLIVSDRNESFIAALDRLDQDRDLLQRLSVAARERIREDYSIDRCADRWVDFLGELHAAAGTKRPIRIPLYLHLPPPLPGFAHQDPRSPEWSKRVLSSILRVRFHAGRLRRYLLRRSA